MRTDQTGSLHAERRKSDQVDAPEYPQEEPACEVIARILDWDAPKDLGKPVADGTVTRNYAVEHFREQRKTWELQIQPKHLTLARDECKQTEDGMRSALNFAIGEDQADGRCPILGRKMLEPLADILVSDVAHPVASQFLPVLDPGATERTISIKDYQWPVERSVS